MLQIETMSFFADNIRLLRGKKKISQAELAAKLIITRSAYAAYESGRIQPGPDILIKMSKYFNISIDLLLTVDIGKYPLEEMINLPNNRIILPIVVDQQGNNYIEIVTQTASMGYLKGFSDPEYIEGLSRMSLPFLGHGKYRAFVADGDSMPPFVDKTKVIGEYVEKLEDLKKGNKYIFVTLEGITFKTFVEKKGNTITVSADNSLYEPYDIASENILEIWKYINGILPKDYNLSYSNEVDLHQIIQELRKDIKVLNSKL